ncbi:hypothetical protein VN97_g695 [Penicillium thymicola]|uniref:Uncharacterized protein n=1 Tax=Penicillium thymicola TaxID=293382 RepID=A0AAI9XCR2_PENTH|nr:hypothetical protein VN97_g695 [Penicillium thymicola]
MPNHVKPSKVGNMNGDLRPYMMPESETPNRHVHFYLLSLLSLCSPPLSVRFARSKSSIFTSFCLDLGRIP